MFSFSVRISLCEGPIQRLAAGHPALTGSDNYPS